MNQPVFWARGIIFWLHRIKVKSVPKMRGKPRPRKKELDFRFNLQPGPVGRLYPGLGISL